MRPALLPTVLLLLSACAATPLRPPADPETARCLDLYAAADRVVATQGTSPTAYARIDGFPYLRTDRFLASLADRPLAPPQQADWLTHLASLDREARAVELDSLPPTVLMELRRRHADGRSLDGVLRACSARLQATDAARAERLAELRANALVPPDYLNANRALGLYPLTSIPVSLGVKRWHAEAHATFALPLDALPVAGHLRRLGPSECPAGASPAATIVRDTLGIPRPDARQLAALFAAHAPVWEIDVAGAFDLPGRPIWQADGTPTVDPAVAVVYRYPSYTRWQGDVLLQLNYLIWFDQRPATGTADLLAGRLDGLVWRVTLDATSRPLIYDSIHHCGCYHQLFPAAALRLRADALQLPEPPLVPQAAPSLAPGERVVVRLSSGSHAIQRVYTAPGADGTYAWADYRELYSVADGGSRRSLFDRDGLVPGTERAERWLLWPMGIRSAGAVRERGRHAVAFVGQRHFDDPDLLERLFERALTSGAGTSTMPASGGSVTTSDQGRPIHSFSSATSSTAPLPMLLPP